MADTPFIGPTHPLKSKSSSVARTLNMEPVLQGQGERTRWVFKDVAGLDEVTLLEPPPPPPPPPALWLSLQAEHAPVRVRLLADSIGGGPLPGPQGEWHYMETFLVDEACVLLGGAVGPFHDCTLFHGTNYAYEFEGAPLLDTSGNDRTIIRHPSNATQTTNVYGGYTGTRAIGNYGTSLGFVDWWVEVGDPLPISSGEWRIAGAIRTADIASGHYAFLKQNGESAAGFATERPPFYLWLYAEGGILTPLHVVAEGWASTTEHWSIDVVVTRADWTYIEVERGVDHGVAFVNLSIDGVLVGTTTTVVGTGGGTYPTLVGNLWIGKTFISGSQILSNGVMDAIDIYTVDT